MTTITIPKKDKIQYERIDSIIRQRVAEVMREILTDPDYGLELKASFTKRLQKSIQSKKSGKTISFDDILRKYGI